jgi:hypothetical protein
MGILPMSGACRPALTIADFTSSCTRENLITAKQVAALVRIEHTNASKMTLPMAGWEPSAWDWDVRNGEGGR